MYSPLVKDIARAIDPEAFVSYTGRAPWVKAKLDYQRNAALIMAQGIVDSNPQPIKYVERQVRVTPQPMDDAQAYKATMIGINAINTGIEKRKTWIQNRIDQANELESIGHALVSALHSGASFERDRVIRDLNFEIANKVRA